MRNIEVELYKKGLINAVGDHEIPRGSASSVLNWLISSDKLELVRGIYRLGVDFGAGKVNSLFTSKKSTGEEVTWMKAGRKFYYYTDTVGAWTEIGTDFFPLVAESDDVYFSEYVTNAGNQVFFSSKNSSLYKIFTANPASTIDMYSAAKNFKGRIKIFLNRMLLWDTPTDATGRYGSYIDNADYTTVTAEAIAGATITRTGTLAFKAGGATRSCFGIIFTDTTETFTDNYDGTLTGSLGGTGTINYATGAYLVTFNTNPSNPVTCSYQWEDSNAKGVTDFTKSATRLAGEGFVFRQDDGGGAQALEIYNDIYYCLNRNKTYKLDITVDDTNATNRIYREAVGIPYHRASVATGEGIYYVDDTDKSKVEFKVLTLDITTSQVIPLSRSLQLDLSDYSFDKAVIVKFFDYILFACRQNNSTENDRVFVYNKIYGTWTILDYAISCATIKNGELLAGDTLSANVYKLFSGFDYDSNTIENFIDMSFDRLDTSYLKKQNRFIVRGLIAKDQSYDIYYNLDNSGFILLDTISGDGTYVDKGIPISIGTRTIGTKVVGSSKLTNESAYWYERELKINTGQFKEIKIRFQAKGIGYVSINSYVHKDLRLKSQRLPKKYR